MKSKDSKFIYTQLSAPIIGFVSLFSAFYLIKKIYPSLFRALSLIKVSTIVIIMIFVLIGSIILWGKMLVFMGILTKEEAKGYPYSKPWVNKESL